MTHRTWKLALALLASLQLAGSVELFRTLYSATPIFIPAPWRLLAVLAAQAAVTAFIAKAWGWSSRQRGYAVTSLSLLSIASIYLMYQPSVSGINVDMARIRHQAEGVALIVVLAGSAVLNLIFAIRRPNCSKDSVPPETGG
jgi:hypothetical protein